MAAAVSVTLLIENRLAQHRRADIFARDLRFSSVAVDSPHHLHESDVRCFNVP